MTSTKPSRLPATGSNAFTPGLITAALLAGPAFCAQPLETETARLPGKGHGSVELGLEYLTSKDERGLVVPGLLRYGVTDRLQLTVEPVAYKAINPKVGRTQRGIGDTELIVTYLVADETARRPALALAGEVKLPTAKSPDLGSGKTDVRVFGIASKRVGRFDLHANFGYTLVGDPAGANFANLVDYAVAAEYTYSPRIVLMAEAFGETPVGKSTAGGPEAATTVVTGMLGLRYKPADRVKVWFAVTYDTEGEAVFKPGIAFAF